MIPIFKSTFSIGKSILRLDQIIASCKQHEINPLVLVEDSMTGFVKSHTMCKQEGLHLVFGLRITCCNDVQEEGDLSDHKIIIFAKDDEGCKLLNKIYSFSQIHGGGKVDFQYLNDMWSEAHLGLVIPFYDSFIHKNQLYLKNCIPNFKSISPTFWLENNNLPFDHLLGQKVLKFAETCKILCNRNFGRAATLSSPNLNHFGSNEFCLESYLQYA
jgi:DNA polymerase III alpha subunit